MQIFADHGGEYRKIVKASPIEQNPKPYLHTTLILLCVNVDCKFVSSTGSWLHLFFVGFGVRDYAESGQSHMHYAVGELRTIHA